MFFVLEKELSEKLIMTFATAAVIGLATLATAQQQGARMVVEGPNTEIVMNEGEADGRLHFFMCFIAIH